ncbi:hypothetical protein P43SY_010015 [Pythium insidiosum]|uniref:Tyrosine-protein kinase ephrin type A/B receptor-like domain-containing protein n=1 Tax=Pythium insidiosum TaxID=114742 RepID=A0AAD5LAT7_PYTIN|nr:hypothetical protein P43SY_010015 [Pythium insidiosum]
MADRRRQRSLRCMALVRLSLCVAALVLAHGSLSGASDDDALVIDSTSDLHKLLQCSRNRPIGFFNEYYRVCSLAPPADGNGSSIRRVVVRDVVMDLVHFSHSLQFHVELEIVLPNASDTRIVLQNSTILASAVRLVAHNVSIDARSSVNVSVAGFEFGPGFNSWSAMGGSYAGVGGIAVADDLKGKCDDAQQLDFFKNLGDIAGGLGNFRGYGSGGGSEDAHRGGGRIEIEAPGSFEIEGSLLANGGDAAAPGGDSSDSAGAGNGTIQSNGGRPSVYDSKDQSGGGGGGGGGRVVLTYDSLVDVKWTHVQAFGGGLTGKASTGIQWCQLGGDGTVFRVQRSRHVATQSNASVEPGEDDDDDAPGRLVGTLAIAGQRGEDATKPEQMYTCTTIFQWTPRSEPFVPKYTAHVIVTGGAALCTAALVLESHISPPPKAKDTRFDVLVESNFVALANAKLTVRSLHVKSPPSLALSDRRRDADRGFSMDKFSAIQFRDEIEINVQGEIHVLGFLQPDGEEARRARVLSAGDAKIPSVSISTALTVEFTPNPAQIGALAIDIHANGDATVDLPFETSQLSLAVSADNLIVSRVAGGGMRECASIKTHADAGNCATLWGATTSSSPYLLSFFGKSTFVAGNITGGSILSCTNGAMRVEGWLVSDGLGCGPNQGPGKSAVVTSASGGAGHGGRGGNVEPGNVGGGKAFDISPSDDGASTSWPIWPGSGAASDELDAGTVVPGHGGGLIYVNAKQLAFSRPNASRLSSRGSPGTMRGGGGAGGAIALFVGELSGPGVIDVSGGDSTASTKASEEEVNDKPASGGGGGGGIIRVVFQASGNGDAFLKDGGHLYAAGGKSPDGGEAGGDGVMVASNCSAGRGGVLCKPCDAGSFSPPSDGQCRPCAPGSFSDHSGSPACALCLPGTFASKFGQAHCAPCEAGTFSRAAGAKTCSPCPPGSFSSVGGSALCTLCPIGTYTDATAGHSNCTLCGIGETTHAAGSLRCIGCTNKPEHASFNVRGNCTYACEKGRNGLDCLTPFERLVQPIGGPMGFVLLVFAFTSTIFGSWGFLTYRNTQRSKHRYAEYKAQTLRDELSLANLTQKLTPRLTDQDLAGHVARLYFEGENHLESSWVLDPYTIPKALRDLVRDDSYAALATACNDLLVWPVGDWEFWAHRALLLSIPPAATVFLRRRQLRRVERLAKFIEQYSGSFIRDIGFRVHGGVQLKVGFSPDFSLAYIDVTTGSTATQPNASSPSQKLSVTSERITIVVAGSGSFFRPFYIDTNDVMVRSVPTRLGMLQHAFWIDFVADVNQRLRLIPQMTSDRRVQRAAEILEDVAAFVGTFNQQHRRDALVVSLGVLDGVEFRALSPHVESVATWLDQWVHLGTMRCHTIKLAFRVSRRGSSSAQRLDDDSSSGISQDPRPIEFRHSRIRMEALFARSPKSGSSSSSVDSDDTMEPLLDGSSARSRQLAGRRASHSGAQLLCSSQSKVYERLATLFAPVAPVFRLHSARAVTATGWSLLVLPVSMMLLIMCDIAIVFFVMMEFYCVQVDDPTPHDSGCSRVAFIVVQSILPLALVGVPTLGLIFLSRKSIFYGKLFATWTIGSLVNLFVGMVCAVAYIHFVRESVLLLLLVGLFIKLLEKEVALRCVAQYTTERPLRGWRGLHTTKDWYDAAYTPLVHQER